MCDISRETLVSLYFYEHLTFEEIARRCDISLRWVKVLFREYGIRALDRQERGTRKHLVTKLDQFDPDRRVRNIMPRSYGYWCRKWDEFWQDVRVSRGLEVDPDTATEYAEAMV